MWKLHACMIIDCTDRLKAKVLLDGLNGKIWNDGLLSDTQSLNTTRPHSDAQNKSAWKAKTVIAGT